MESRFIFLIPISFHLPVKVNSILKLIHIFLNENTLFFFYIVTLYVFGHQKYHLHK